ISSHNHPRSNCFPVKPVAIPLCSFNSVTKSMPQVKNGPHATFTLVLRHHLRLDLAGALHSISQSAVVARHQCRHVLLKPLEKGKICDQSVFDDSRNTC